MKIILNVTLYYSLFIPIVQIKKNFHNLYLYSIDRLYNELYIILLLYRTFSNSGSIEVVQTKQRPFCVYESSKDTRRIE